MLSPEVKCPVHLVGFIVVVILNGVFELGQDSLHTAPSGSHDYYCLASPLKGLEINFYHQRKV